jgi:hypothetical protein
MKPFLTLLILVGFLCTKLPARPVGQERRLQDINVISTRVLQRSISPKFYQSLLISPIKGWIVVRANIINTHVSGARVIRSELNGAYDQLALKFANDLEIAGYYRGENPLTGGSVLFHLLVYQIADGTMILDFPTFNEAGGNQMYYWGCARLGVVKGDGRWVEIEGPEGLHGRGWEVRPANRALTPTTPLKSEWGRPPREKKYMPAPPRPTSSVLAPVIASNKR